MSSLIFLALNFDMPSADAQEQPTTETVAVAIPVTTNKGPEDALNRGTPRGSILGFLDDFSYPHLVEKIRNWFPEDALFLGLEAFIYMEEGVSEIQT